jgi:hypothetical protein
MFQMVKWLLMCVTSQGHPSILKQVANGRQVKRDSSKNHRSPLRRQLHDENKSAHETAYDIFAGANLERLHSYLGGL